MVIDAARAYELLKRLSFARPSGSAQEAEAAALLVAEAGSFGLHCETQSFPVWAYEEKESFVDVLAPFERHIPATPAGLTGTTGPDGVRGELVFVETGEEEFLDGIKGKIALTYGFAWGKKYERLTKAGPKAVICIGDAGKDLLHLSIGDQLFKRFGKLPMVCIRYEDALALLKSGATEVRVVCDQIEREVESHNVIAEIAGTGRPDEVIVLCGHYDTVPGTVGAHDNAGGSVILMELARWFAAQPARRTLRFIWCGSEELGLYGSFAYVNSLSGAERERIKLVVNVDVAGGIIGSNGAAVIGNDALKACVEALGKELGIGLSVRSGIMSSDGIPFGDRGIPSVNVARSGGATTHLHTAGDALEHTDGAHLAQLGEFARVFVERTANARAFPFEREVPDNLKKEIAKYKERSLGMEPEKKDK